MPPLGLTALNLTSEAYINVSWSPLPTDQVNGILLGYSLKYQRIQTSEREVFDTKEHTLNASDLSISLQVQTYSTYRIQVAAFTRKGMGPYSEYAYASKYLKVGTLGKPRRQRQRERGKTKGLMSRTMVLYVHYETFAYLSAVLCKTT